MNIALNMFPGSAIDDCSNILIRCAELFRKGPKTCGFQKFPTNQKNCACCEFGSWVASLFNTINCIFRFGSNFQMSGITAVLPPYARVQNEKSIRYIVFVIQDPCHFVSVHCNALLSNPKADFAIPVRSFFGASPDPAMSFIQDVYFAPKAVLKFLGEKLPEKCIRDTFVLHNKIGLLCRALGCSFTARAFSL